MRGTQMPKIKSIRLKVSAAALKTDNKSVAILRECLTEKTSSSEFNRVTSILVTLKRAPILIQVRLKCVKITP